MDLGERIAAHYGVRIVNVLTIGEQIGKLKQAGKAESFIFGFEESYCYLTGSYVRVFFASTFSSKMQIDFLKVAWGISPVLHFLRRHSFRCRRGAVAGIQSLLVTDM